MANFEYLQKKLELDLKSTFKAVFWKNNFNFLKLFFYSLLIIIINFLMSQQKFILFQIVLFVFIFYQIIFAIFVYIKLIRFKICDNSFKKILIFYQIKKILNISALNNFISNFETFGDKKEIFSFFKKYPNNFIIQGSCSLLLYSGIFWRRVNDIDLLVNNEISSWEHEEKNFFCNSIFKKICSNNIYAKYFFKDFKIEVLPLKIIPSQFRINIRNYNICNIYWQIAMKIFQLIEYLLVTKNRSKMMNVLIDLIWLYSLYNKQFRNYKNVNEALNYLLISNFFVYYFLPYKKRLTTNYLYLEKQLKLIFANNLWLKNLNNTFYDDFVNNHYFNKVFDFTINKEIDKISTLLKNREIIWKEIIDFSSFNNLNSLIIKSNLKNSFWFSFSNYSKWFVMYLNYCVNDVRCYLLTKLNIKN